MKKNELVKKLALGAALTGAALQLGGCVQQDLYGPPPEAQTNLTDPSEMPIEDLYGPPVAPPDDFTDEEPYEEEPEEEPEEETVGSAEDAQ